MDRTFSARCGRRRLLRQGEKLWLASPRECLPSSVTTTMLKNAHVVKIDNYVFEEDPPACLNFPLAVPPTLRLCIHNVSPDIHISLVRCPDHLLSLLPPQEDASLIVPVHSSRAGRQRRQERLPPSPCPLPAPPSPLSCPSPKISCCPWVNNRPIQPLPTMLSTSSEAEDAATRFFIVPAPYLFSMIYENSSKDNGSQGRHPRPHYGCSGDARCLSS